MRDDDLVREPASVGGLVARALRVLRTHWIGVTATAALTVAAQGAVHAYVRLAYADAVALLVAPQLLTALCYAYAGCDVAAQPPRDALWGRVLERLWAVVVVNAGLSVAYALSLGLIAGPYGGVQAFFMQLAFLLLQLLVAFADVIAVIHPNLRMRDVLPRALAGSARLVANPLVWTRVLGLIILVQVLDVGLGAASSALTDRGAGQFAFWLTTATSVAIAAIFGTFLAVLYLDADLRQRMAKGDNGD